MLQPPGLLSGFTDMQHFVRVLTLGLLHLLQKNPKKQTPGLVSSLLFSFLPVCFHLCLSCFFFRHITNATLAILKGETVPLDVLQIKVKTSAYLVRNIPETFLFTCCSVYMDCFSSV